MYKKDLASNNLQWLIYRKTKPNQTKTFILFVQILKATEGQKIRSNNVEWNLN